MSGLYDDVKKLVIVMLRGKDAPDSQLIRQHISVVVGMQRQLGRQDEVNEDALYRDILGQVNTWQAEPSVLRDRKHVNWLPVRKAAIQWDFWKRYRQYLEEEKNWPSAVTARLDTTTDSILGDVGNPAQQGPWDRRGMVVGEVQSGKTANYTGLICKAVDAGYKLIIVLAGLTNDLRSQTQSRLDAEFLGFESEVGKLHSSGSRIGVGLMDTAAGNLIAHPLTYSSHDGDFRANRSANLQLGGSPLLLVVKKNKSVLERILSWAENQGKIQPDTGRKIVDGIPLLLLDDEADNASVNTKDIDEDPTQINKAIRLILNAFQQRSYVGYTATPFANIFILPDEEDSSKFGDDLFPKGFIYSIIPPTNYIGAKQLFGLKEDLDGGDNTTAGLPLIRRADDALDVFPLSHKKELVVKELPESLLTALKAFVITCAARRVRGQKDVHNSMLIHVTRFNLVQQKVMDLVSAELVSMVRMIEFGTGPQSTAFLEELRTIWIKDYVPTVQTVRALSDDPRLTPINWEDVKAELHNAATRIQVRGINGEAGGALDYDANPKGLHVIAVGGDKLSRGLTLEGLSISYYLRPSKNYDTLLQMGRWFGYRPGYVDLCRLFTTVDLVGWYQHVAVANEELRREFNFMELSKLTPQEYGLKVRTHPDGLSITAANKIRHGRTMRVSFSNYLAQTTIFHKDSGIHEANFALTDQWVASLKQQTPQANRVVWNDVKASQIIAFLEKYTAHPLCRQAEGDLLVKYIQKLLPFNELKDWTVALISNSISTATDATVGGYKIRLPYRSDIRATDPSAYQLPNANILNPEDEQLDLSDEQRSDALEANIAAWSEGKTRSKKEPTRPSGPFIRGVRPAERGLLLLYPLDYKIAPTPFTSVPIVGFALSFPKSRRGEESAIEYQVNTKFWRDRYGEEDDDV